MRSPPDPLEALRQAGVAKEQARERERNKYVEESADEKTKDGYRATSALGVMAANGWWAPVGATVFMSCLMLAVGALSPPHEHGGHVYPNVTLEVAPWFLVPAGLLAAVILISQAMVRGAANRERRWLATLPFPIHDHFRLLGSSRSYFRIQFGGQAPDAPTLRALLAGVARAELELDSDKNPYRIEIERQRDQGAHAWWGAWRGVISELLLVLHARYPIASVTVDS